ncbi:50S ribosomal protein L6 [bacterium F16]|nr:50S ribosomal protein L6 [bacterium F16]
MSRIGNQPIPLKKGVSVDIAGSHVTVKGPNGTLVVEVPAPIAVAVDGDQVVVSRPDDSRNAKSLHGLARTLVYNMVVGVDTGFKKELEIRGIGYRAEVKGKNLVLSLGYSHPIEHAIEDGITINVDPKKNTITVTGADKQRVGQVAAEIRSYRKPDAYKGKGVRYVGEFVLQKEGKTV